jgi:hypothetical protein
MFYSTRFPLGRVLLGAALCLDLIVARAGAQDRPSESEMFGVPATSEPSGDAGVAKSRPTNAQPNAADGGVTKDQIGGDSRDQSVLGSSQTPMFTEETPPFDPLTIGGQMYLRAQTVALEDQNVGDWALNLPTLLDVFFDARPNERVRGFVLGRMSYDPMLPPSSAAAANFGASTSATGTSGSASLSSVYATRTSAPRVLLDQLWLRFDIARILFITAGRQHVRWGTARFWTPTDFLHLRRRDPLAVFDARGGTTMLKVHLPIESNSWNFYA